MNRHDLDLAIEEHDEHIGTCRYFSGQAVDTEDAMLYFDNLSPGDREKIDEAVSLLREVADRHDERAKQLDEEYGPL